MPEYIAEWQENIGGSQLNMNVPPSRQKSLCNIIKK